MKKTYLPTTAFVLLALQFLFISYTRGQDLPYFIDKEEIENFDCKCLEEEVKYSKRDQKYIDILWEETLKYLEAYAIALTTSTSPACRNSDIAIYETTGEGFKTMCIMDQRDMQLMVKHIYMVINNPDKAKKCFSARRNVDWIYSPGGQLESNLMLLHTCKTN